MVPQSGNTRELKKSEFKRNMLGSNVCDQYFPPNSLSQVPYKRNPVAHGFQNFQQNKNPQENEKKCQWWSWNIQRKPLWIRKEKRWSGVAMNECHLRTQAKICCLNHQPPKKKTLWKVTTSKPPQKGHSLQTLSVFFFASWFCHFGKPNRVRHTLETWNKEQSSWESKGRKMPRLCQEIRPWRRQQGVKIPRNSHEITPRDA